MIETKKHTIVSISNVFLKVKETDRAKSHEGTADSTCYHVPVIENSE